MPVQKIISELGSSMPVNGVALTVEVRCENVYNTYNECFALSSGGSGSYTYSWWGGSTSGTWTGACTGQSPQVTVTDSSGAQASARGYC